jgi:uncharacterized lipoprotein NlpE involved in copper resistance
MGLMILKQGGPEVHTLSANGTAALVYAALTGHVHYLASDGEWCVTVTRAGMLWEHLRKAGEETL